MSQGKKFSKDKIELIVKLYNQGLSSEVIGKQIGSKAQTITKYLKKEGIVIRGPDKKLTDEDKKEICRLYQEGHSTPKLAEKFNVCVAIILKYLEEGGVQTRNPEEAHRKYAINENFFDVIDTEEKAYFLGFLYADGSNCKDGNYAKIELEQNDIDILIKFSSLIYKENPRQQIKTQDRTEEGRGISKYLTINSKHICAQLEKWGCPQAKTFLIKYPDWLPEELQRHFIRGYFDGDGSCTVSYQVCKNAPIKFTSTKEMCEGIQKHLNEKLSILLNIKYNSSVYDVFGCGNRLTLSILDYLYDDATIFLDRKRDLYIELRNKMYRADLLGENGTQGFSRSAIAKTSHIDKTLTFDEIISIENTLLTKEYISLLSEQDRLNLIEPIFKHFRESYWKYPDNLLNLDSSYQKLLQYTPDLSNNELNNNDSLATDICKHFCHSFYKTTEKNKPNMIDLFNDDEILKKVIKNRLGLGWKKDPEFFSISFKMLIQGMRSMRLVPMISIFKPSIAKYVNLKYSQENDLILDYSAGFGGRMLGAAASKRKYIGIDPLTIKELIKMRDYLKLENCQLIASGSENFLMEENSVDLAWSSPPYYDQEYYSPNNTQAYNRGEEYFYNVYWINTLNNCRKMLKPNKWFGLNVKNYPRMLSMAVDTFGPVIEEVKLKTHTSHLNQSSFKFESIYMFINKK